MYHISSTAPLRNKISTAIIVTLYFRNYGLIATLEGLTSIHHGAQSETVRNSQSETIRNSQLYIKIARQCKGE